MTQLGVTPLSLAICCCLAACDASTPQPPRSESEVALPQRDSTVTVPLVLDLATLASRLNSEIPTRLLTIDENRDACVPAQWVRFCPVPDIFDGGCAVRELRTKVTPDIDCHLDGHADRGTISVAGDDDGLVISVPVSASVTVRGRGEIGKNIRETASGSIVATARVQADVTSDWTPVVSVNAGFRWDRRAQFEVLGIPITIGSKIEPELKKLLNELQPMVATVLSDLRLRERAADLWKQGFTVLALSERPDVWLRFTPSAVGFSGLEVTSDTVGLKLMATGLTETFVGSRPSNAPPSPLPQLQKYPAAGGFSFYLPIFADYAAMEGILGDLLALDTEQTFALEGVGEVRVTFRKTTIYPTTNESLAIGVAVEADGPGSLFDTKGTIWASAKLAIDNDTRTVTPTSLDYGADTDNAGTNLLLAVMRFPTVRESITRALTYDFSSDYERALSAANGALTRQLDRDLIARGEIAAASVDQLTATPQGVYLGLNVSGDVIVTTTALAGADNVE